MSGWLKKEKRLTLTCDTRKSPLEKGYTGDIPKVLVQPWSHNKNRVVPGLEYAWPKICLQTLAKVFLVNLPGNDKNRAFLANDWFVSPDPDFSSEAN